MVIALIATLIPMSAFAEETTETPFTDVGGNAWYRKAVGYAYENNLFSGTSSTTFSPETSMTRGMFVTVLGRMANVSTGNYGTTYFYDVKTSDYFSPYVQWAASYEIVSGTAQYYFSPNQAATREQIATLLYRFALATDTDTTFDENAVLSFSDNSNISSFAKDAMNWAVTHGILYGSNGKLNPKGSATRAEVAQIFYNSRDFLTNTDITREPVELPDIQTDKVWVVDVPGHYETVEWLDLVGVTVGEEGHWEDEFYTHWVYRCNQCGYIAKTVEEINAHQDANFDWESMTGTCWAYTMISSEPEYTGEKYWVVDVPGHIEYQLQVVTEEIWVEEVGHWEYQ